MSKAKTNGTNSMEPNEATRQVHEATPAEIDTPSGTKPVIGKIEADPFDLPISAKTKKLAEAVAPGAEKQRGTDAMFSMTPKDKRDLAEADHTIALSFARNAEKEGVREHPQLAAFYAVQRATEQQFKQSGMSAEQQKIAAHALKAQLASQIEKGAQLSVQIREPATLREPDKEAQR